MIHAGRRTRASGALVAVALVAALLVIPAASAPASGSGSDPRTQQQQVRQKKAEVASQIDALKASDAEVQQALSDLEANVASARAQMNDAQRAVDDATAQADQLDAQAATTQARIDELRGQVVKAAVEAFVHPQADQTMSVFEQDSGRDAATRQAMLDVTNASKFDVIDEFRGAKQDLEVQRDLAAKARDEAIKRKDAVAQKVSGLRIATQQQQQVATQVNQRIEDKLAESASLAALDSKLADQIATQQAALIAKVAKATPATPSGGDGGGGGRSGPIVTTPGPPGLSTVRGITVASSIAGQLASLLSAADAAGFKLSGGGYRDSAQQIALRKAHCGTTPYAIYEMPPSQCHPPTARPGASMHEQGLAIDFTSSGHLIQSRSDPAFQWMASNAGSFGFRNLPSEPWHWSVNGN